MKTKEEILEQCYKNHKARIGYPENVFKAMQLYADQESSKAVEARDAEILEWIEENIITDSITELINTKDLKQFIQSKTKP